MNKRKGFTLIETLIVLSIVVVLATAMIGAFNPEEKINRAKDLQRKEDLNKIKVAFEEYFNNHGGYPFYETFDRLNIKSNCGTNVFSPWLMPLPCDPDGQPYLIILGSGSFSVLTNLENKNDSGIPKNWYKQSTFMIDDKTYSVNKFNYGVSSSNILWYERYQKYSINEGCSERYCYMILYNGECRYIGTCNGDNCYYGNVNGQGTCESGCKTNHCGS